MIDMRFLVLSIDCVIAITLVESVALVLFHRVTGRGVAPREFVMNLVSGLLLMLALRCLAHDVGAIWIASCLLAAGLAHCTDLRMRWRRNADVHAALARTAPARTEPAHADHSTREFAA